MEVDIVISVSMHWRLCVCACL